MNSSDMPLFEINELLRISNVAVLVLTLLLFVKQLSRVKIIWVGILFVFGIICYLLVDARIMHAYPVIFYITVTGAICIPFFFLLLSKGIFDDHFSVNGVMGLLLVLEIVVHAHLYLKFSNSVNEIFHLLSQIVSLGFVVAGLTIAISTRKTDLVESRIRFRIFFIFLTAVLIAFTLAVEGMKLNPDLVELLQIFQRLTILCLTSYFLTSNFEPSGSFFFPERQIQKKTTIIEDPRLLDKLNKLFNEEKIYRTEGLTIQKVAEKMDEQEYRIRRLINTQMNYKNFNDFLNQYRVNEACEILADPHQNRKTILEISYQLGYKSIGPFNKAFKELIKATPTVYRKQSQENK